MKTELERYKEALRVADRCLLFYWQNLSTPTGYADRVRQARKVIDLALNPPPEMEEVEVVRWECPKCAKTYKDINMLGGARCCDTASLVKLTGSYKRPKVQPVEKSIPVTLRADGRWVSAGPAKIALKTGEQQEGRFVWTEPAE